MDIKLDIPRQDKLKGAFAQLPELPPDNPFFKRVDRDEGGHVYEAKQRCWYWLWTIIGPMDGGDYVPTLVSSEELARTPGGEHIPHPQTAHAWMHPDYDADDRWQHGGRHLHHWHGGEIAQGACIYIGAAPWNPDSVLIPGGSISLSAGGGDI